MSGKKPTLSKLSSRSLKRHFLETLVVCLTLGAIMWATTLITPFESKSEVSFYSGDTTTTSVSHLRATVTQIEQQSITVKLLDGDRKGQEAVVRYDKSERSQPPAVGSTVVVDQNTQSNQLFYVDKFRIPGLVVILSLFIILVLVVGRRRGLTSIAGLVISIIVVGWFIIPLILAGFNALWVSIAGAYIIAFSSILIAHGRKPRTYISIACVSIVLLIVAIASQLTVGFLSLSGIGDETSIYLAIAKPQIDMTGILAGGIIIASLGVLDDIITAQVATVDELQKANSKLTVRELYKRASSVGSEHIASLVNTLALVYVGAALPVIISLVSYNTNLMLLLNGEYIATEIVRTIIASAGLVIAVPVSTIIASVILYRKNDTH